ncbi:hypothetical protein AB0942_11100 [Streptomyces nodosus]|uniref:hypothetical protein n=1 Tax=Streptomyces nodosus TaxID=40318 RepID=UPI003456A3FC
MKLKLRRGLTVGAAAVATLAFAASPAFAGNVYAYVPGAQGWGDFSYNSRTRAYSITLSAADIVADGYHVRVRAQSEDPLYKITSYPWRENHGGNGTRLNWATSLTDTNGIWAMRIQVCTFTGDTPVKCDTSPWDGNPYY